MGAITLEKITKAFDGRAVLDGIDLEVAEGEFLVVLGASGGGKSTLLNLIAGLLFPDSGRIRFGGRDVTALDVYHRNVAYVFQDYALYPHMTAEENVRFPLENMKLPKTEIHKKTRETLDLLKLDDVRGKLPAQLSGGQKQRVAIGRALVRDPYVFLFDEPLSNLDPQLRDHLQLELKQLHRELNKTFLYVTHDQHSAMVMGDRVGFLSGGAIQQAGPPMTLYRDPVNLEVARFFGFPPLNVLSKQVFRLLSPYSLPEGTVHVGIRPEHLILEGDPKGPFEVMWVQKMGYAQFATIRVHDTPVCGLCADPGLKEGMTVGWRILENYLMFFDAGASKMSG